MVESSRLVFKLLCVKLKSLNFDFIMDTTTQFNLHHNIRNICWCVDYVVGAQDLIQEMLTK